MSYAQRDRYADVLCHYCLAAPGVTRDHIVPVALGGPTRGWNIVRSCPQCNHEKGSTWPTCVCEKCTTAVKLFCSLPEFADKAIAIMEARRDLAAKNLETVKNRIHILESHLGMAQNDLDVITEIILTNQTADSIV